ncbi:nuclease-related domain-containing protein [Fredinandcohnia quinoae]|uniref:NERD domain-containing protein n=1 Tax=Fredinandcohnia quinoae TaxID=2918902 RepID=A0AAW5EEL6_9BACI|nr:nuclease-related domain-containing protein [Fredinandcohnia sp. SECRCQ15]MCH1627603.1 NERD domain-containing protein [Fredinandcohnia sp. SECRCQ15]
MILKIREESKELLKLRALQGSSTFTEKDNNYYLNLEKGYAGELFFDKWIESLSVDCLILNDLLFEVHNNTFQIDSCILAQEKVYLFEVKNFEGDFFISNDKWYTLSRSEIQNPVQQLSRSETLFRKLLKDAGYHSPSIESFVIFVNPNFFLYQAQMDLPIIFPNQIPRFLNSLNKKPSKLTDRHWTLADNLLSEHIKDSPFSRVPTYEFETLKKGIKCISCRSFFSHKNGELFICPQCRFVEKVEAALIRSIREFILLFPELKVTTVTIFEWCGGIIPKQLIQRYLSKRFILNARGKAAYYIEDNFEK